MSWECRERFPRHWLQTKPLVSGPDMDHGTCVTHVPWCMSGLLTRGYGINVPGIPGAWATRKFMYLARGPCPDSIYLVPLPFQPLWPSVLRMAQACSVHQMSLVVVSGLSTSWRSRRYQGLRMTSFKRCAGQANINLRTGSFFNSGTIKHQFRGSYITIAHYEAHLYLA